MCSKLFCWNLLSALRMRHTGRTCRPVKLRTLDWLKPHRSECLSPNLPVSKLLTRPSSGTRFHSGGVERSSQGPCAGEGREGEENERRTESRLGTLEEVAPRPMVDLEAGDALGVPLHAELVEEELDEVALGVDDVDVAPAVEALVLLALADDDVPDVRLLVAAVPVLVLALVVRLEAKDEELDRVVLRVRQELAARVDCRRASREHATTQRGREGGRRDGPWSSIARTAMCCFSR